MNFHRHEVFIIVAFHNNVYRNRSAAQFMQLFPCVRYISPSYRFETQQYCLFRTNVCCFIIMTGLLNTSQYAKHIILNHAQKN
jgi:hypothetical protein